MSVEVQFAVDPGPHGPEEAELVRWAEAVIEHMGDHREVTDVCIRLVGEGESERLNAQYRSVRKPTNVLSFPAELALPESAGKILGDILICDPVVRREAEDQKKPVADHYAHMIVHGMLHLYGYDHIEPAEADEMEDAEREILDRFGVVDPYLERLPGGG